jgi:hypothetical protein
MFIQINEPTRCINLSDLSLIVQIQLNMFWASSCPSSGAYKLQWQPLVYRWNVVVAVLLVVVGLDRTDHDQQHCYHHVATINQRLPLQFISS